MSTTDKLYGIDEKSFFKVQSRIMKTVSESGEKQHLCMEDINALARFLAYRLENGDDNGQYEHVVDFLWMSAHIEINCKKLLLDLADE